ncbi:MAG: hypothetical protein IH630_04050 [Thermoplasmata archaeon]|nr:hypothetical protein [Thermoplasmata archaeon]TFG69555.1 MAG: hypothetical protein E4H25_04610 [Methanomassiliicoccus sp.]
MRQSTDRKRTYSVEELIPGDKAKGDKITVLTIEDLDSAYRDLNDGKDIMGVLTGVLEENKDLKSEAAKMKVVADEPALEPESVNPKERGKQ